ncbi:CRISPR-associated endonuclease/helicase Cas3 [Haloactinospora alba]|uniref:CRISPR-associated endonuclease/helicase Cas3 n=1 Tax=Haloactinospora alba TaxID=405555 RepID=A0A543NFG8_9ACTN|nr:type I-U CRISPR-associated helicase/endonuclease Cas3 [Haloactinospora alba]TQN30556.1 CRISPR-associated endonuclease/helicase Cas3 [Haloactinospora alba]
MTTLDAETFSVFYTAVHGHEPLPWQQDLARRVLDGHGWPDTIDVPTGLGKTSTIDIAVFAAAADAPEARRRVFFVVDRRLVVDDAYDHAQRLAAALNDPASHPPVVGRVAGRLTRPGDDEQSQRGLEVARMRGGTTWSWRWVERPDRHAVVVGTVDQIGSRLLMRGYGLSPNLAPIDAALVGTDSLVICDEAHLSRPFLSALGTVTGHAGGSGRLDRPRVVAMSATTRRQHDARTHTTTDADGQHPVAGARLHAPRGLHLVHPKVPPSRSGAAVVDQIAGWARELAPPDSGRVVLSVCNTVARARAVFDALGRDGVAEEDRVLLTGRSRPLDREYVLAGSAHRFLLDHRDHTSSGRPCHVVSTQTVEVGANIDADALVTESASVTALTQRLGRLGRAPERRAPGREFPAVVVHDPATSDDDPVYGPARNATWNLLTRQAEPLRPTARTRCDTADLPAPVDASPVRLRELLAQLNKDERDTLVGPDPLVPQLWENTLRAWTNTSPRPHPDPPVAPYLHGRDTRDPDIQLLWRADITREDLTTALTGPGDGEETSPALSSVRQRLQALPPAAEEMLNLPVAAVTRWAEAQQQPDLADLETASGTADGTGGDTPVVRYRGRDDVAVVRLAAVRPGDVVVLPSSYGGCDDHGWNPASRTPVLDVADLAGRRGRPQVRLTHRLRTLLPPESEEPDIPQPHEAQRAHRILDDLLATLDDQDSEDAAPPTPEDFAAALTSHDPPRPEGTHLDRTRRLLENLARLTTAARDRRLRVSPVPDSESGVVLSASAAALAGDDDTSSSSTADTPVELDTHQDAVARQAAEFARNIGLDDGETHAVWLAARHHDQGKRDPRFQAMLHGLPAHALGGAPVLAKSGMNPDDPAAFRHALARSGYPPGMRHEALSARIAAAHLERGNYDVDRELVLHLVASHHGRARPLVTPVTDPDPAAVPDPDGGTPFNTGEVTDWHQPARFERLQRNYGVWRLALLETVVRMADIWCSAGHPVTTAQHPAIPRLPGPGSRSASTPRHTVELPALDGRDPLGFLAALGTVRLLTEHTGGPVGLGFDPLRATAHLSSHLPDLDAVAEELHTIAVGIGTDHLLPAAPPEWPPQQSSGSGGDPLRVPTRRVPDLVRTATDTAADEAQQRTVRRWLSVILTDLAEDNQGRAALTPFMAPAGRQTAATFFKFPLEEIRAGNERLYQALAGWRRVPGYTGEYLDHRAIRTAGDLPSGESTPAGVPGATWLATHALPLLGLTGDARGPVATLWYRLRRQRVMVWPVWQQTLDEPAIRALLGHPGVRPRADTDSSGEVVVRRANMAPLGVMTVGAAQRRPVPGGKSAGPLVPVSVRVV